MVINRVMKSCFTICMIFLVLCVLYLIYYMWFAKAKTEQTVDISPLSDMELPLQMNNINDIFDKIQSHKNVKSYEVDVVNGINKKSGLKRTDGLRERISFKYENDTYITVHINTYNSISEAIDSYNFQYDNMKKNGLGISNHGIKEEITYFASLIERVRGDMFPDILSNDYISNVYIQSGNMLIDIFEKSKSNKIIEKDAVIRLIADKLFKMDG